MSFSPRHPRLSQARHAAVRWSRAPEPHSWERGRSRILSNRADRSVLIVAGDDFERETLGQILERRGYRVLRAANGYDARRQVRGRARPGLIVLDLLVPGVEGWEFFYRHQADAGL